MNGAQALIESLLKEQVDHIFGYAGATICPIVDVLKEHPEIGYTLVRTEQNAGTWPRAMPAFPARWGCAWSPPAREPPT